MLREGETAALASYGYPFQFYSQDLFLIWRVAPVDASLAMIVKVESVILRSSSATLEVTSIDPNPGEFYSWKFRGDLDQRFFQTADKVFPSGQLDIQARGRFTTMAFKIEVLPVKLEGGFLQYSLQSVPTTACNIHASIPSMWVGGMVSLWVMYYKLK